MNRVPQSRPIASAFRRLLLALGTVVLSTPVRGAENPALQIELQADGRLILSWPVSPHRWILQSTPSLTPPISWSVVNRPSSRESGQNVVTLPATEPHAFYRLRRADRVLFFVNSADPPVYSDVQFNLGGFAQDVAVRFGITVEPRPDRYYDASGQWLMTPAEIRAVLAEEYARSGDLAGAIFAGTIPFAEYEFGADAHSYHPAPFYYEDFEAEWVDNDQNGRYETFETETQQVPDGIAYINPTEIWTAWWIPPTNDPATHASWLNAYLSKLSAYFAGALEGRDILNYISYGAGTWPDPQTHGAWVDIVLDNCPLTEELWHFGVEVAGQDPMYGYGGHDDWPYPADLSLPRNWTSISYKLYRNQLVHIWENEPTFKCSYLMGHGSPSAFFLGDASKALDWSQIADLASGSGPNFLMAGGCNNGNLRGTEGWQRDFAKSIGNQLVFRANTACTSFFGSAWSQSTGLGASFHRELYRGLDPAGFGYLGNGYYAMRNAEHCWGSSPNRKHFIFRGLDDKVLFGNPFVTWHDAGNADESLIPLVQHGSGEHSWFAIGNSSQASQDAFVTLALLDTNGQLLTTRPTLVLAPGQTYHTDTRAPWFTGAEFVGTALFRVLRREPPTETDRIAAWCAVTGNADSPQPGFSVAPSSATAAWPQAGVIPIPYWAQSDRESTFYSIWNPPSSQDPVAVEIALHDYAGQLLGTASAELAPGAALQVDSPSFIPVPGEGTGTVSFDFRGAAAGNRLSLWSAVYSVHPLAQVGFDVPLALPSAPAADQEPTGTGTSPQTVRLPVPLWQSGWTLETFWSFQNAPGSPKPVDVQIQLFARDGTTPVSTSPRLRVGPGRGLKLSTADPWYTGGDAYGVAEVRVTTAGMTAPTAHLIACSSAIVATTAEGYRPGMSAPVAGTAHLIQQGAGGFVASPHAHEAGQVLIPFWQAIEGWQTFWSIWNLPESRSPARVTLRLRDVTGAVVESVAHSDLRPGQAWMPQTTDDWYTASSAGLGGGEIMIEFDDADDRSRLLLQQYIYGEWQGEQIGYGLGL